VSARRAALFAALCLLGAPGEVSAQDAAHVRGLEYHVLYEARLVPSERSARVAIHVYDDQHVLRELLFSIDPGRQIDFRGDGKVDVTGDHVSWVPPPRGGTLRYTVRIDHLKDETSYDARSAETWAIVRGDDLVPPARIRTEKGGQSVARLRLRLPEGWSSVTPYPRASDGSYEIDHVDRRFDRPVGWILVGRRLGVVRERVAGVRIAIGSPAEQGMRRLDLLALLRWTLPTLRKIVPLPDRMTIVGAGDPMWRGGLSGRDSVYLHASLPLISSDGTSTALHELMHALMRARAGPDGDWVVEGMAEVYSLQLLVRSHTISRHRYHRALENLAKKGRKVRRVTSGPADHAITARSVGLLLDLDQEIRRATDGARGLDDVLRAMVESPEEVTLASFRKLCEQTAGTDLSRFFGRRELRPSSPPASASPAAAGPQRGSLGAMAGEGVPGSMAGAPRNGTEGALLEALRAGRDEAYEELVRAHGARLLAVARRFLGNDEDARDAVQDAFLSAFRSIGRFEGNASIATWLHRIVVNASLMKLRTRRRKPEEALDDLLPSFLSDGHQAHPAGPWRPEAELERRELRELVRLSIDRLPDAYRTVILLRDVEELDTAETAAILGVGPGAVKTRLPRARQALRTLLDPHLREDAA
jgi:RNA polymerase sigma factor (sigma-70 family)